MKITAIGDIHGRIVWKSIIENETFDKVVFIGDYFDSKEGISGEDQRKNFQEIIHFKKSFPDKVVLLIGNHDYHYLKNVYQTYRGFQAFEQPAIQLVLNEALSNELLQISYRWKNFLFTHAGVSKLWFKNTFKREFTDQENIDSALNNLFKVDPRVYGFMEEIGCSRTGDDEFQSPLWIRPKSLLLNKIDGVVQIVGHTVRYAIENLYDVVFIDTLETSGEYLFIDNGTIIPTRNQFIK
jgi:predicted phosphodiesterase